MIDGTVLGTAIAIKLMAGKVTDPVAIAAVTATWVEIATEICNHIKINAVVNIPSTTIPLVTLASSAGPAAGPVVIPPLVSLPGLGIL